MGNNDDKTIMSFKDEEGNKVDFEVVAEIYIEEQKYLILSPLEGEGAEKDAFIFRVDENEQGEEYNLVEDDKEFEAVKKEYKDILYKNSEER